MGKKKRSQDRPLLDQTAAFEDFTKLYFKQKENKVKTPKFHWCLLAEIIMFNYHPKHPHLLVKDSADKEHSISLCLDNEKFSGYPQDFQIGHTLALLYADYKKFKKGLQLDDMFCKVFRCSLSQIMIESERVCMMPGPGKECSSCGKNIRRLLACAGCKLVWYCGQDCQVKHWKEVHKDLCPDMRLFTNLITVLNEPFDDYTSFPLLAIAIK